MSKQAYVTFGILFSLLILTLQSASAFNCSINNATWQMNCDFTPYILNISNITENNTISPLLNVSLNVSLNCSQYESKLDMLLVDVSNISNNTNVNIINEYIDVKTNYNSCVNEFQSCNTEKSELLDYRTKYEQESNSSASLKVQVVTLNQQVKDTETMGWYKMGGAVLGTAIILYLGFIRKGEIKKTEITQRKDTDVSFNVGRLEQLDKEKQLQNKVEELERKIAEKS